jgi:isopropylmalate/homocitrate/citramalate synthase
MKSIIFPSKIIQKNIFKRNASNASSIFLPHPTLFPEINISKNITNFMNNLNPINNLPKKRINIYEMFMRDGLQSLPKVYTLDNKKYFVDNLIKCNITNIEFGSTTSPKLLPQMDNSYKLWNYLEELKLNNKYNLTMLISNNNGLKESMKCYIKSFGLLCSVSDSFGMGNLKKNADKSFEDMIEQYLILINNNNNNFHARFYLSCSFGTFKDDFDIEYILRLKKYVTKIYDITKNNNLSHKNIDIVLCDTMGILTTSTLKICLNEIIKNSDLKDIEKYISLHLHTTNQFHQFIEISLNYNINKFDSSVLNIGGCPFSGKQNYGNINTLELVKYLEKNNYDTGINYEMLEYVEKDMLKILNE